jgi:flagellar biosynthetic protein FlhB
MSENNSSEDKQFEPSQKRLDDLKKDGTVLRAKDYGGGMMILAGILIILNLSPIFLNTFKKIFSTAYGDFRPESVGIEQICGIFKTLASDGLMLLLPIGFGMILMAFMANFLLGGLHFSKASIKFKGERLDLFKNLKKMVSPSKLFEVGKSTLKIILFLGALLVFIMLNELEIISLSTTQNENVLIKGFIIIRRFLFFMIPPMLLLMFIDAIYSFFAHQKKIKMTHKEVKDERKDMEGSPEVKQKVRAKQHELARINMQRDVPLATVVITNPTHFAVALKYQDGEEQAPKIVAKGADNLAQEIKRLAIKSGVPIYQAPPLARAIYFTGKVGSYIDEDLYRAVAMVLVYVSQLKQYQQGLGSLPDYIENLPLPESVLKRSK